VTKRYLPKVGDLVSYKNEAMVVIALDDRETMAHVSYDRTYYLLPESVLEGSDQVPSIESLETCMIVDMLPSMKKFPRFVLLHGQKYEVKPVSYVKITKKVVVDID